MPIFTFVFGYSLILMKQSLERKKLRVKWHLFRRAIMLIIFGVLHSTFLWEGDILFLYGLMGIFLLPFINRKPKTLLIWGIILFSLLTVGNFLGGDDFEITSKEKMSSYLNQTMTIYSSGTYSEVKDHRLNVDPMELEPAEAVFMLLFMPFLLSPLFLFGMYAAHRKWLLDPIKNKKKYWIGTLTLIPLGVFLKVTPYVDLLPVMSEIGGILLSLGYICLFAFAYANLRSYKLLTAIENVGKLSLTNYIMQTVICTFIFYGYGFGFFAKLGIAAGIALGVVIFTLQMFCSTLYLRYFKQGPLERLMRVGVYLRLRGVK